MMLVLNDEYEREIIDHYIENGKSSKSDALPFSYCILCRSAIILIHFLLLYSSMMEQIKRILHIVQVGTGGQGLTSRPLKPPDSEPLPSPPPPTQNLYKKKDGVGGKFTLALLELQATPVSFRPTPATRGVKHGPSMYCTINELLYYDLLTD